jgi:hypothetical protein
MNFEKWFAEIDRLGVAEAIFDPSEARFLCPGSKARRPYAGDDGFFRSAFDSGMTPQQALGEALVEQDGFLD